MNASNLNLTTCAAAEVTAADIDAAVSAAVQYKPGETRTALFALEALIRRCPVEPDTRKVIAEWLARALDSDISQDAKLFVCRQLWQLGVAVAGPVLSRMLVDDAQVDLACYAIAQDPDPDAGQLLRDALGKATGRSRMAVVNLLGDRRDVLAVDAIRNLVDCEDTVCAEGAIAALGKIGSDPAATALAAAHGAADASRKLAIAHALLACTEGLVQRGRIRRARAIYSQLDNDGEAGVIRKAARLGVTAVETCGWRPLFDGETYAGWEGNMDWFRIEDGAIVAGSLEKRIPNNEFLCTTTEFADFELRLDVKLLGKGANAGIQIRSERVPNHHEVSGYQADMGQHYWGALYDESRRNKILTGPGPDVMAKVLNAGGWNDYVIRCVGRRVQLWINGFRTVDYTELDDAIPATGIIGLQIHSGAPSEAWYRSIRLRPESRSVRH